MPNNLPAWRVSALDTAPDPEIITAVRDELLEKISDNANLPALGTSVSKVIQLASSDDEAVRNLAHFVMSDVGLTQKILRIANAACYRSTTGSPVTTVSKAIFLLGFETVKTSALGMLLVERMSGSRAADVRTELLLSLNASIIGREVARRAQVKDAEEAAIAALFKNMGPLLVASHDHLLYKEVKTLTKQGMPASKAASQVIGCTFEWLAESVMQQWEIPESIIGALAPVAPANLRPAKTRQEWIQQVAAFSSAAASMLLQPEQPESDNAALIARFGAALNLDQAKLEHLLASVAEETRALAVQLNLNEMPSAPRLVADSRVASLWDQLESQGMGEAGNADVSKEEGLPLEFLLAASDHPDAVQSNACHPSGKPLNARELLLAGVQDVTEVMASGRCKVNDLVMLVLETIYRSMGFRFATVCLKDIRTNQFCARIALGENNAARQKGFVFSANPSRDLFHLSLGQNADLLISDATDPKIRGLIPVWHKKLLPDTGSFIVLPLVVQKKPVGLFYADRTVPALEGVAPDETAMIKTLKGQVIAALNAR